MPSKHRQQRMGLMVGVPNPLIVNWRLINIPKLCTIPIVRTNLIPSSIWKEINCHICLVNVIPPDKGFIFCPVCQNPAWSSHSALECSPSSLCLPNLHNKGWGLCLMILLKLTINKYSKIMQLSIIGTSHINFFYWIERNCHICYTTP